MAGMVMATMTVSELKLNPTDAPALEVPAEVKELVEKQNAATQPAETGGGTP